MRARDNPFAVERVLKVRYFLNEHEWDELFARLARLNHRAAIVGPEGHGKTTLLEDISERLIESGTATTWLHPPGEDFYRDEVYRKLRDDDFANRVLLFDGADLLNGRDWRVLIRAANRAVGLIVTSHQPCRLSTVIQCRTSPELLRRIVSQLLPEVPDEVESLLPALYDRHAGNLRNALRELYDLYAADRIASVSEVGPVCRTGPEARQRRTASSRSASGTYRSGFPPSRE
jgi:hypothetical protein